MAASNDPMAIIGIGCRFPGADNLREFWRVLVKGENHIVEVPRDRWNAEDNYSPDPDAPGKTYIKKAGFIKNYDRFDNKLFGINESEAAQMDPQQRQVLECTYMALENAGITRQQIAGQNVGVFIGSMNSDFSLRMSTNAHKVGNYTVSGTSASIISNRVSYVYNLTGPSMTIDTACSSSLVAIHQAANAIRAGDCDMAICGGVNMMIHPTTFIPLCKARMLSPTGQCHAFSANADGYTRGEGCGIVILKPLSQAENDKSHIWGTIATGLNQDGRAAQPITAPSGSQQRKLLEHVYKKYNIEPSTVDYIEAHGTGTKRGDPVEIKSFGEYFTKDQASKQRYLGSVKTNIGHLESAAGVAGLIKVLLMMKHNTIVPSLHFDKPNEEIDLDKFHFVVPTKPLAWTSPNKVACLNSFGFGGANSHAVITQYIRQTTEVGQDVSYVVPFSGSTTDTLTKSMQDFVISHTDAYDLRTIAFTAATKREHFPVRKAFVVNSKSDLSDQINKCLISESLPNKISGGRKVIFVFCGMGTAWQGMCKNQLQKYKQFELHMKDIDASLKRFVTWSLIERLQESFSVEDSEFGPIAVFACQVALAKLWAFWGVKPSVVVGQSIGEVAAAHFAGILSLDEAVKVIYHRTRVLKQARGGKMLLIKNLDTEKVEKLCLKYTGKANIALYYSPTSCTVSGNADVIDNIKDEVQEQYSKKEQNILCSELPVSCAFHSHHVDECKQELDSCLEDIQTKPPSIKMVSSVDVKIGKADLTSSTYWGMNLRQTVKFNQAIREAALDRNLNIYLEIGPRPVLGAHIDDIFKNTGMSTLALPSILAKGSHDDLLRSLASIYQLSVPIDWASCFTEKDVPVPVPTHAFIQNSLSLLFGNGEESERAPLNTSVKHMFIKKTESDAKCILSITPSNLGTIYEHKIKGIVVLPGATYAEAGFGILQVLDLGNPHKYSVSVTFSQPVTLRNGHPKNLYLDVLYPEDGLCKEDFSFVVRSDDTVHAEANVTKTRNILTEDRVDIQYIQLKCKDKVSRKDVYNTLESSGLTYGDSFATIDYAFVGKGESLAKLKMSPALRREKANTVIHPAILDGMLQAAAATGIEEKEFLPTELKNVIVRRPVDEHMFVHSQILDKKDSHSSFLLTLLSSDGCIIATVERFTIKYIGKQQFDERTITFLQSMEPVGEIEYQRDMDRHAAIFTDMEYFTLRKGDFLLREKTFTLRQIQQNQSTFDTGSLLLDTTQIFFIFPMTELPSYTGESLQNELMKRIMPLRQVILYAVNRGSSIPLRIVTETRESGTRNGPEAASLCLREAIKGFVRCVLREHRSMRIQLVDVSSEGEGYFKTNILSVLSNVSSDALDKYPEITYKKSVFYSHQILPFTVEAPLYRMSKLGKTTNAVLSSQSETAVLFPCFVPCGDATDMVSKGKVVLEVLTATIHSPHLHGITLKQKDASESEADIHSILSFETTGYVSSKLGHTVCYVSCHPNVVRRQIAVPQNCLIAKDAIRGYSQGFLTKLYLLWCICDVSDMTSVAILYLPNTEKIADALSILLLSRGSKSVSLLTPDEAKLLEKEHYAMLIATIQLTSDLTEILSHSMNFKNIVCVDVITKQSAFEHLTKPDISVQPNIIRPMELFSSTVMREAVPRMLRWVKVQSRKTEHLANLFESTDWVDLPTDIQPINLTELLQTSEISFTRESGVDCNCMKTPRSQLFQKSGTYLVVGGLTGLGWECVSILAQKGAGCIVILSRSKPKPERVVDMKLLASTFSCNVVSIQVDVTDFDNVHQALIKLKENVPTLSIKGVFFGAAVLGDSSLLDMTDDTFRFVTSPKIIGSWNMHVLMADTPLDFFVMHSSIASVFGNDGQSNYGAGNGFMDGLAICRQRANHSGQSISWGPLNLGMLEGNRHIMKRLEAKGLLSIDKKYIGQCLMHAMMLNEPQMTMCLFDEQKIAAQLRKNDEKALLARLQLYLRKAIKVLDQRDNDTLVQSMSLDLDQLRKESAETKKRKILKYMTHIICDTALIDESLFDQNGNLREQGVDSMYAMEISGKILSDTQIKLSANELLFGTVDTLSDHVIDVLFTSKNDDQISDEKFFISKDTIISSITKPVLQRIEGETNAYFVNTIKIPDIADATMLRNMAKEIISRHMTARTSYKEFREQMSWGVLTEDQALDFRVISTDKDGLLNKYMHEALDTNTKGPLRFIYVEKTSQLTIITHRVAFDLKGITLMVNEFLKFGEALTNGLSLDNVPRDPDLDSIEEIQKAVGHRYQQLQSFWKQHLPYICCNSLTKSKLLKAEKRETCVEWSFDKKMYTQMLEFSKENNISPFHIMASIFQLLLAIISKTSTSTVLLPVDLRAHIPTLAKFVGRCTNCIPLTAVVSDDRMTVREYFHINTTSTDRSVKNALLPLDEIQALMSDDQKVELFRNFFIFHDDVITHHEKNKAGFVRAMAMGPHTESYMFVYHRKIIATIDVKLYLRKELFSKAWSETLLQLYKDLVSQALNHPSATLAQLKQITQFEMEKNRGVLRRHKMASRCSPS